MAEAVSEPHSGPVTAPFASKVEQEAPRDNGTADLGAPDPFPCVTCSAPAPPRTSRRGRTPEKHPACGRWSKFWTAAQKALEEIDFPETAEGDAARERAASELIVAANALRAGLWARDASGRFAGKR